MNGSASVLESGSLSVLRDIAFTLRQSLQICRFFVVPTGALDLMPAQISAFLCCSLRYTYLLWPLLVGNGHLICFYTI